MHRHTEPGIVVEISKDGLRRADNDNALNRAANSRDRRCRSVEIALIWLITIAFGVLMGATAAQTLGTVS